MENDNSIPQVKSQADFVLHFKPDNAILISVKARGAYMPFHKAPLGEIALIGRNKWRSCCFSGTLGINLLKTLMYRLLSECI